MAYLGNSPGVASQRVVTSFTATSGQTTFTPQGGYTLGYVDVYLNGVKLVLGDDYTASNGTTVVLVSGASVGDSVEVVAFIPRGLSDGYTKLEADNRFLGIADRVSNIIVESKSTIISNLSITNGYNGMNVGPVTVATGASVTVASDQRWLIFG